jgi:2-phosphosulfolactate phosphatase
MPKVEIYLAQSLIKDDMTFKDKNVIIIDVLRATSTMTVALANGAKEIIPAESVSTAARIARGSTNSMLCGERGSKIIEGFDLGNSPLEFKPEIINGKSLIFSTTNGTLPIVKSKLAKSCVLASFLNLSKVIEYIKNLKEDITLVCSGKLNNFCLEDAVCAGVIIKKLLEEDGNIEINDPEYAALELSKLFVLKGNKILPEKILELLKISEHGKYLSSVGFKKDLEFCSKFDTYPFIPMYIKGAIRLKEKIEDETNIKAQMKKIK